MANNNQIEIPHEGVIYRVYRAKRTNQAYPKPAFTARLILKDGVWYWEETLGGKLWVWDRTDTSIEVEKVDVI